MPEYPKVERPEVAAARSAAAVANRHAISDVEPVVFRDKNKPEMVVGRVEFSKVQDSGVREDFSTGSVRDSREGKGRYDLVAPRALRRLARHYENGARKYQDRNWEKGQPLARFLDSALRHLNCVLEGKTDEDHLAAVAWNVFAVMEFQERIALGIADPKLDDLPRMPFSKAPIVK